jgi:hypothetical protein
MSRRFHLFRFVVLALVALLIAAGKPWAAPFSQRKIIIEVNGTAGDGGIQIFVDAVGWRRLEVFDPNGEKIFDVAGSGSVGMTGVTELFFESAEPSFEDLPLDQLLDRFPAGNYVFRGTTVDGKSLFSRAPLAHNIPAGPSVVSPEEGAALDPNSPVVIDWDQVTSPFPGTTLPVMIGGYQAIVERVHPQPLLVFSVFLPAAVTEVTVPPEFIEANAEYKFEILAIEQSGNQTITESAFSTTSGRANLGDQPSSGPEKAPSESREGSGADGVGAPRGAFLRSDPNPFRLMTTFEFGLPDGGVAALRVFDVSGRVVRTLVNGRVPAGEQIATWDGKDAHGMPVASGVYLVSLDGPGVSERQKVVLAR